MTVQTGARMLLAEEIRFSESNDSAVTVIDCVIVLCGLTHIALAQLAHPTRLVDPYYSANQTRTTHEHAEEVTQTLLKIHKGEKMTDPAGAPIFLRFREVKEFWTVLVSIFSGSSGQQIPVPNSLQWFIDLH